MKPSLYESLSLEEDSNLRSSISVLTAKVREHDPSTAQESLEKAISGKLMDANQLTLLSLWAGSKPDSSMQAKLAECVKELQEAVEPQDTMSALTKAELLKLDLMQKETEKSDSHIDRIKGSIELGSYEIDEQSKKPQQQGTNLDLVEQLTKQNAELLEMLFEKPFKMNEKEILSKTTDGAKKLHENTDELDQELAKLQQELTEQIDMSQELSFTEEVKHENPEFPSKEREISPIRNVSIPNDTLMAENYNLRKQLIESEAKFVLFQQHILSNDTDFEVSLFKNKAKEQNREIQRLIDQKVHMMRAIGKLKSNNSRLSLQVNAKESLEERLKSLMSSYTNREKYIEDLKQALEKQELRTKIVLREARTQRYQLLKTISDLSAQVSSFSPNASAELPSSVDSSMVGQISKLEIALEKTKNMLQEASTERSQLTENLKTASDELKNLQQTHEDTKTTHEQTLQQEKANIEQKESAMNKHITEKEESIKGLEQTLQELRNNHSSQSNSLRSTITELENAVNSLTLEKTGLEDSVQAKSIENQQLQEEVQKLNTSLAALQEEYNSLLVKDSQEIESLTKKVNDLEGQVSDKSVHLEETSRKHSEDFDKVSQDLENVRNEWSKLEEVNKSLSDQLQHEQESAKGLKEELEGIEDKHAKEIEQVRSALQEKEQSLEEITKSLNEKESILKDVQGQLEAKNEEIGKLSNAESLPVPSKKTAKKGELTPEGSQAPSETSKSRKKSSKNEEGAEEAKKTSKKSSRAKESAAPSESASIAPSEASKKSSRRKEGEEGKKSSRSKKGEGEEEGKKSSRGKKGEGEEEAKKSSKSKKGEGEEEAKKSSKSKKSEGEEEAKKSSKGKKEETKKSSKKGEGEEEKKTKKSSKK